jgi:hypothetical protein
MAKDTWESIGTNLGDLVLDYVKKEARRALDVTLPGMTKKANADVHAVLDEVQREYACRPKPTTSSAAWTTRRGRLKRRRGRGGQGQSLEDRRKAAVRLTLDQKRELGIVNDEP